MSVDFSPADQGFLFEAPFSSHGVSSMASRTTRSQTKKSGRNSMTNQTDEATNTINLIKIKNDDRGQKRWNQRGLETISNRENDTTKKSPPTRRMKLYEGESRMFLGLSTLLKRRI